ncbi:MAG TPA: hypothetical protein VNO24_03805 [Blastocatellia bacterium]|nr:hypothetical protein [Blastocatellia bacterium]
MIEIVKKRGLIGSYYVVTDGGASYTSTSTGTTCGGFVREQQAQIKKQTEMIESQQNELHTQGQLIKQQQSQLASLKRVVCKSHSKARNCR